MRLHARCAQCGADYDSGCDCESCFHALLAFENENPPAFGAVHHVTVIAYYLQHPHGYPATTLALWREFLDDALSGRAKPAQLQQRARATFDGAKRVRDERAEVPNGWPTEWPMTVQQVLRPDERIGIDEYVGRARAWAEAVNRQLKRTDSSPRSE